MSPSPESSTSSEVLTSSNGHDNSTEAFQQIPLSEKPRHDHQDQTLDSCGGLDSKIASQDKTEAGAQEPLPMRTLHIEEHYKTEVPDDEQSAIQTEDGSKTQVLHLPPEARPPPEAPPQLSESSEALDHGQGASQHKTSAETHAPSNPPDGHRPQLSESSETLSHGQSASQHEPGDDAHATSAPPEGSQSLIAESRTIHVKPNEDPLTKPHVLQREAGTNTQVSHPFRHMPLGPLETPAQPYGDGDPLTGHHYQAEILRHRQNPYPHEAEVETQAPPITPKDFSRSTGIQAPKGDPHHRRSSHPSPTSLAMGSAVPDINILVLGETQSGKSTFIEAVRTYVDPTYRTSRDVIGTGVHSHTRDVHRYELYTDLPQYRVYPRSHASSRGSKPVDYRQELNENGYETFEDILNDRKATLSDPIPGELHLTQFNIFDTPGLNDTNLQDELHVANIVKQVKGLNMINQVLVMIPPVPFTPGFINAIKTYVKLLPELCEIIAFVHTRVNYASLHPQNDDYASTLLERMIELERIIGRDTAPHFLIDSRLDLTTPVRKCITLNTINSVLSAARFNRPVSFSTSLVSKTRKMSDIDNSVYSICMGGINSIENTLISMGQKEGRMLHNDMNARLNIQRLSRNQQRIDRSLEYFDSPGLCLVFEALWNQWWETPRWKREFEQRVRRAMAHRRSPGQSQEISENGLIFENIQNRGPISGLGDDHARHYQHRKIYYERKIERLRKEKDETLKEARLAVQNFQGYSDNWLATPASARMQPILDKHSRYIDLACRLSSRFMSLQDFSAIVCTGAYMGSFLECTRSVERFYNDRLDNIPLVDVSYLMQCIPPRIKMANDVKRPQKGSYPNHPKESNISSPGMFKGIRDGVNKRINNGVNKAKDIYSKGGGSH